MALRIAPCRCCLVWRIVDAHVLVDGFTQVPSDFIPVQDKGDLIVNVQLARLGFALDAQQVMGVVDKIALGDPDDKQNYPRHPGRWPHAESSSGQSILLSANGSNFGSTFVMLKPFDKRA